MCWFAGADFARQILVPVWSDLIQVLQCPLQKVFGSSDISSALFQALTPSSLLNRRESDRDLIIACLDALRECIKLCRELG